MKKTLAAVLAAAMALSTATVAFAVDNVYLEGELVPGSTTSADELNYGEEYKWYLSTDVFTREQLGRWLDDGIIKVDAIVTEGRSAFETVPTISAQTIKSAESREVWKKDCGDFKKGDEVLELPVTTTGEGDEAKTAFDPKGTETIGEDVEGFDDILAEAKKAGYVVDTNTEEAVQVKFKVRHTYGTSNTTVKMKFKITFKKAVGDYKKGHTYTTDEIEYTAKYHNMGELSKDMVLTLDEVKPANGGNVILDGSGLYDKIGNDTFSIQFEDTAVFEAKASSSQKKVNLFYNLDEITAVTDAYPDVDFEFISFKGNPSFVNSGTMTFNAIGGKNTQIYTFDGETLTPLTTTYDSSYKTVTAKGIKKLGTFVVASEILEVEDEEDNEPVSSAPVVEESSSQPFDNSGDRNPSTGAC